MRPAGTTPGQRTRSLITVLLEQRRDRGVTGRQTERHRFVAQLSSFGQGFFQTNASSCRVASGDQGTTRGCANRRRRIGIEQANALRCEQVEIWSLVIWAAVTAQIAV